ncbi:MAG: hypothetical protein RL625_1589 [Gemmatimonadota bacterium]
MGAPWSPSSNRLTCRRAVRSSGVGTNPSSATRDSAAPCGLCPSELAKHRRIAVRNFAGRVTEASQLRADSARAERVAAGSG